MTHIPEVLEVMDGGDNLTSKKNERAFRVPYILAVFFSVIFLLSLLVSTFLFYKYSTCCEEMTPCILGNLEADLKDLNDFQQTKTQIDVRLPRSVVPDSYSLKIIPFVWEGNFTFDGEVSIIVNVTEDTNNVTLHSLNLNISEWHVYKLPKPIHDEVFGKEEEIEVHDTSFDTRRQFYILHFNDKYLEKNSQYRIHIRYIGSINDNLKGFYRSSYKMGNQTRWIAVTQFQATDARQAFPCFDEPCFKAKFTLSIGRLVNMTTLSNMPISDYAIRINGLPPDYVLDMYEESVPMSTYLVAFAVTDFYQLSEKKFHVWARQEAIDQARYALTIGSKILTFYEQYFQIDYPLPKMDMIALPDFASGAMENWGLITYRETTMLYKEGVSARFNKESVATIVAHELAHQWFGNLVTPEWWSDLWLNEGFATYMEYLGTDSVEPSWKILDQFVVGEMQNVLTSDALLSSHPISIEVSDPDEINEIFDGISYSKGASIIRMMDHFLTKDVFKRGLTNYITSKAYQCATQDDLWNALTEEAHRTNILESNITVKQIMDTWTLQTGFPVITVVRNYNNNTITVTQSRFLINSENTTEPDKSLWWIPLTYTTRRELDFTRTKPSYWMQAEPRIEINDVNVSENDWILFNMKETGYYRVNYDNRNWELIIQALNNPEKFQMIDPVSRAQLINDAMKLAHSGILKYSTALDITMYLQYELEYVPWIAAFGEFQYLHEMLRRTGSYDKYKTYILFLVSKLYESTGFFEKSNDDQLLIYKRVEVLSHACKLGFEDCIRNSVNAFQSWKLTPQPDVNNPISPNLKGIVYCTAIKVGGQKEWEFAWQRYLKSNVGTEKDILLGALGCTRETWILSRYLEWALNETSGIRKQDVVRVFNAVSSNVIGQPLAWAVLRDQWDRVVKYLGSSLFALSNVVKIVVSTMNTEHEVYEIIQFALKHRNDTGPAKRAFLQAIEKTSSNQIWMKNNYNTIVTWLEKVVSTLPRMDNIA